MIDMKHKDKDKYIYRIFSLNRFEKMLLRGELSFARPSKWEDPYEDMLQQVLHQAKSINKIKEFESDNLFGQCWTYLNESDAMWRIYSANKTGVKVKIKLSDYYNFLRKEHNYHLDTTIIKVEYKTNNEIEDKLFDDIFDISFITGLTDSFDDYSILRLNSLALKRKEFSHEKEVRFMISFKEKQDCDYAQLKASINDIFISITLDPRLSEDEYLHTKQKLKLLGFEGTIYQSQLYKRSKNLENRLNDFFGIKLNNKEVK